MTQNMLPNTLRINLGYTLMRDYCTTWSNITGTTLNMYAYVFKFNSILTETQLAKQKKQKIHLVNNNEKRVGKLFQSIIFIRMLVQ